MAWPPIDTTWNVCPCRCCTGDPIISAGEAEHARPLLTIACGCIVLFFTTRCTRSPLATTMASGLSFGGARPCG